MLDVRGRELAPCPLAKAERLLAEGRAALVSREPLVIRLPVVVDIPEPPRPEPLPLAGRTLLLHICCGPCATCALDHLRGLGFGVTGYWFGPNIHPYSEHDRRREALATLAAAVDLPVIWEAGYEMQEFLGLVAATPQRPGRCHLCYRMRLERTAAAAAAGGFDAFSTTLLISPYQDLDAIGAIGAEEGEAHGVRFHFENLRQGFAAHHRLAREHGLYLQRYCGCVYSEWEGVRRAGGGVLL